MFIMKTPVAPLWLRNAGVEVKGAGTPLRCFSSASLGVSVVEAQLGYLKFVTLNPIHHAVFSGDPA